ncbi:MAG: PKD domain-containing protein [Desulfobacterales bacterium]|nr:PKD domain-containing protein [Desulfobacterales bacterium]
MKKNRFVVLICAMVLLLTPSAVWAMSSSVPGPNRAPVAQAGMDQHVEPYEMVVLDGSGSFDPEGDPLTYQWDLLAVPPGGRARLTGTQGMQTCRLSPDVAGAWIIRLTVSDGRLNSEGDVVVIEARGPATPPTKPDLKVTDIQILGKTEAGKTYIKRINAHLKNSGLDWLGPLEIGIIGMGERGGGNFTLDERATFDPSCLMRGDEKWFTLTNTDIEWPADVSTINFGVSADPNNRINEINEQNNFKGQTIRRNELQQAGSTPPYAPKPDFEIMDIRASGLYQEKYINDLRVKIWNQGSPYRGPVDFRLSVLHQAASLVSKTITIDQVCLRQWDETWITLSRREIAWPATASSLSCSVTVDPLGKINEVHEENNAMSKEISRGAMLPFCNIFVSQDIGIRDYQARMSTLKQGKQYIFDCKGGDKFDFFFQLQNFCYRNNSIELYIVYDWTPVQKDGENIVLKKGLKISNITVRGDYPVEIQDLKIPRKQKFEERYTTFAILAHHDRGYDVLFSAPVKIVR